jgi:hypothetical protein
VTKFSAAENVVREMIATIRFVFEVRVSAVRRSLYVWLSPPLSLRRSTITARSRFFFAALTTRRERLHVPRVISL